MRILSSHHVSQVLLELNDDQLNMLHKDLYQALSAYSKQHVRPSEAPSRIIQPLRTVMVTSRNITTLTMPVTDTDFTSVKTVTVPPDAPIKGAITVFSADGELLGLLNAAEVTAFRTALTSMLALSRSKWGHKLVTGARSADIHNLVVFGGGRQAEWHTRLALRFSAIKTVTIVNRSQQRREQFEDNVLKDLRTSLPGVSFKCLAQERNEGFDDQLRQVLSSSDIICCTTPSTEPLFPAEYLKSSSKSRFISLIGSYKPHMQEIDTETLLSGYQGKVIVDSREACLEEAGELIRANMSAGQLVEIGELSSGIDMMHSDSEDNLLAPASANVIAKCVGLSLMDLAVSRSLLGMCERSGIGTEIENF